jgi:hypothetical protein
MVVDTTTWINTPTHLCTTSFTPGNYLVGGMVSSGGAGNAGGNLQYGIEINGVLVSVSYRYSSFGTSLEGLIYVVPTVPIIIKTTTNVSIYLMTNSSNNSWTSSRAELWAIRLP